MDEHRPPKGMGARGRALWRDVTARYELTPSDVQVLRELCCATDELSKLTAAMAHEPMMVKGSRGQPVAHPLLAEVRAHRENMARLAKLLALPDEPGKRARQPKSNVGRAANFVKLSGGG
jgi:P27 family predicted phage terminase small subunit